jgi:hypothetical protein
VADHHRLSDVYGISRELPLNYVPREGVDGVFVESLTRDKHIVVYGSSKQGKYNLTEDDHVVVTCSNKWTGLAQLHTAILKAAGYTIEQSTTKTAEGTFKVTAKLEGKAKIAMSSTHPAWPGANRGAHLAASDIAVLQAALDSLRDPVDRLRRMLDRLEFCGL